MNIALITIHWANNYGAALQVYASTRYLSRYGNVSVIDYRCSFTSKGMQVFRFGWGLRDFLRMGKDVFRLLPRYRVIKKFSDFNGRYLNVTSPVNSEVDFIRLVDQYDAFVSGSDQIWNPNIVSESGSINGRYFLDFVSGKKKVSYASSMGTYKYSAQDFSQISGYLSGYDFLSVREADTASYLEELLARPVAHVLDPTLLMGKDEWLNCFPAGKKQVDGFILVYALKKDALLRRVIEVVSAVLKLKVYAIDQDPLINYSCDRHMMDVGPDEFVDLFSQASFVVTNSFHGTAFSVNFNVPFLVTTPPTGINRISSLLDAVGLENRVVESFDEAALKALLEQEMFFGKSNQKLNDLRRESTQYIDKAFGDV